MSLVSAKCPLCGKIQKIDGTKDALICDSCGQAFVVKKAIQYFENENSFSNAGSHNSYDFNIVSGVLLKYCGASLDVIIPNGVLEIGAGAFGNYKYLKSVTIPNGVLKIGDSAFQGCSGLTSISLPDSITDIGNFAFQGCSGLTSISLPDSITDIGNFAFQECSGLTSVYLPDSITEIGNSAFQGCSSLESIILPDSLIRINNAVFKECSSLKKISIPDDVTVIGESAFSMCRNLAEVELGNSLQEIMVNAFFRCNKLSCISVRNNPLKEPDCFVFPCTTGTIHHYVFTTVPKKIVFLHDMWIKTDCTAYENDDGKPEWGCLGIFLIENPQPYYPQKKTLVLQQKGCEYPSFIGRYRNKYGKEEWSSSDLSIYDAIGLDYRVGVTLKFLDGRDAKQKKIANRIMKYLRDSKQR